MTPKDTEPRDIATELDADDAAGDVRLGSAYLVHHGADRLEVVPLEEGVAVLIGRAPDARIRIDSPRASRQHTRITLEGGRVMVEDLGSRNGTRVGAHVLRSEARAVAGGETVRVGPLDILVARTDRALAYGAEDEASAPAVGDASDDDGITTRDAVIVADPAMVGLFQVIRRVSATNATILVHGETGAGKEIVAERIHRGSPRAAAPYVRLNCASLPEALLESELFGHERGAFTGADRRRIGYFEAASGGTMLLDEIGEMPASLQAKLLRVLEERLITRVGGTQPIPVDVRIVCATHRDLQREVAERRFREDLYFRISTFTLEVPPLRERRAEILLLADLFARRFAADAGVPAPRLSPDTVPALLAYQWPGNVRELRNALEHAVVMAEGGAIEPSHLPRTVRGPKERESTAPDPPKMRDKLEEMERRALVEALAAEGGNRTRAARRLSISRRAVIYKMIKYGLR